jgi:hypothetical protein
MRREGKTGLGVAAGPGAEVGEWVWRVGLWLNESGCDVVLEVMQPESCGVDQSIDCEVGVVMNEVRKRR